MVASRMSSADPLSQSACLLNAVRTKLLLYCSPGPAPSPAAG